MSLIKIFKRNEKGSITLMLLAAMIFVLVVITASYFAISNKSGNQDKKISKIAQQYRASDEDMDQEYRNTLNNASLTIEQAQSKGMFEKTTNTELVDAYENQIVVPAGFRITEDAKYVTQGVVIEDKAGNQFVWIPVGNIYTDVEKTESGKKTIALGRYEFAEDGTPREYSGNYTEDTVDSHDIGCNNAIAKDIDAFKNSVNINHGYYIGRYEAGVTGYDSVLTSNSNGETNWTGYTGDNTQLVCKSEQQVWNYVTQNKASELSRSMYTSSKFTSDLINSYAWDTAIVFIQEFSGDVDYARQIRLQSTLTNTGNATDGMNCDVRCNIYDMAGNCSEWTTESYNFLTNACVIRGSDYSDSYGDYYTCRRRTPSNIESTSIFSFRSLLYIEN